MSPINGLGRTLNSINQSLLSEIHADLSKTSSAVNRPLPSGKDRVDTSRVSQLFHQLEQLQTANPVEFKKVATDAATKLTAAAQQATDPGQAAFLTSLADKFQKSADAGSLSPFHQRPQVTDLATPDTGVIQPPPILTT